MDATRAELGGRIDALDQRVSSAVQDLGQRIDATRAELGGRMDTLNQRLDTVVQLLARPGASVAER